MRLQFNEFGRLTAALLAGALLAVCPATAAEPPADAIIENANIVPMTADIVLRGKAVVIRGGRISALVDQASAPAIQARTRIDGRGGYLIPALADMHVHVEGDPANDFRLWLANGVTTVRNMNDREFDHLRIRADAAAGRLGPVRYLTAGPAVTGQGLATAADVDRLLTDQAARGYDVIKLRGDLQPALYDALIGGARARGLKLTGHGQSARPIGETLRMGGVEHAEEFLNVVGHQTLSDPGSADRIAAEAAASGAWVTPTLAVFDAIWRYLDPQALAELKQRPGFAYVPPAQAARWGTPETSPYRNLNRSAASAGNLKRTSALLVAFTGRLHRAGAPLLLGTDAAGLMAPGFSVHDELDLLAAAGLSPFEALRTATANPARYLGEEDQWGTIQPGLRADLVLLGADPLADVRNARAIRGVYVRGRWWDRAALDRLLAAVPRSHVDPKDSIYRR